MDNREIGLRIKQLRQIQRISQKDLAEKIGTTTEMVSRYETGKSSAYGRLDKIVAALGIPITKIFSKAGVSDFSSEETRYYRNLIPYLTEPILDLNQALKTTKLYYSAPDWVVQKTAKPFAIDCQLLAIQTTQIERNGVLIATQEIPESDKALVLFKERENLVVSSFAALPPRTKPLATVVAWEKRFV
jgi:transcriptional regulator with XRE-family HTH domain